jgi:acetyltransferase-like isoleucine patch superfamily enzyme
MSFKTTYNNFLNYYNTLSISALIRLLIFKVISILSFNLFKKVKAYIYFGCGRVKIEKNVTINGFCKNTYFGDDIIFYSNSIIELQRDANLKIGSHVIFSYGSVLSCSESIQIGNDVQIGEYTSIRDTTHDYTDYGQPIMNNSDISSPIIIGNNVWIGRNCLIMPGTVIEDGVVIGANTMVKGYLKANQIYVGNPMKEIKSR